MLQKVKYNSYQNRCLTWWYPATYLRCREDRTIWNIPGVSWISQAPATMLPIRLSALENRVSYRVGFHMFQKPDLKTGQSNTLDHHDRSIVGKLVHSNSYVQKYFKCVGASSCWYIIGKDLSQWKRVRWPKILATILPRKLSSQHISSNQV